MSGTFIRLDRSLLKHRYFDNTNVLKVWLYCLMKASYKRHCHLVGSTTIELEVGQFIFGRDKAASDLNMSVQTLRTIMKLFENDKKITIKPTSKFSIITVINFDSYQITDNGNNQQNNHQLTINQPATNQQLTTNKKVNKVNKENTVDLFVTGQDGKVYSHGELFEALWKAYPSKDGKKEALRHYNASVKNELDMKAINLALSVYLDHLSTSSWKNPKNGSTWFNNWQDWTPQQEP